MKLLLTVHKLGKPTSHHNLTKLTGRPIIITAHRWITSNPSCLDLLGIELDRIILQLKNLFKEWNIPYPLIYNPYDLLLMLDKLRITNNCTTCVSQLLTSHPFTPTYHTRVVTKISSCRVFVVCSRGSRKQWKGITAPKKQSLSRVQLSLAVLWWSRLY